MDLKPYNKQEFNKLCANFLGGIYDSDVTKYWFHLPVKWEGVFAPTTNDLKFHSDWNWIMEVVKKIILLRNQINHKEVDAKVYRFQHMFLDEIIDIDFLVKEIWEFLNWYNEQKS